jgi:hypothetical protein
MGSNLEITLCWCRGLLPKASLERGEPLSRHHALRDTSLTDGKSRLLSRMVSPVYWALVPVSMTSSRVGVALTFPDSRSRPGKGVLPHFWKFPNSLSGRGGSAVRGATDGPVISRSGTPPYRAMIPRRRRAVRPFHRPEGSEFSGLFRLNRLPPEENLSLGLYPGLWTVKS